MTTPIDCPSTKLAGIAFLVSFLCAAMALLPAPRIARGAEPSPGVVSRVKVLSDKVEDVSSIEAWAKGAIKDGMTGEQKALAAWEAVVKFRHHDVMPQDCAGLTEAMPGDPIKYFNVYGYCTGIGAQTSFLQLARHIGLPARGQSVNKWGAPEVYYDDAWHCFDAGMIAYYKKPDGKVASVEEIINGVKAWYETNPGLKGDVDAIKKYLADGGIAKGPEILRNIPTMDARGNYTLNYFGWYSAMIIFDGSNKTPFLYEEPVVEGYQVNIQLRRGEKLTRNWSNKGLHVNMLDEKGQVPECLKGTVGKGPLYYTPKLGDLANGRIGNGTLEYDVPLAEPGSLAAAAISTDNLASRAEDKADGAVHVKDAAKPGVFVLRMPCSYVYLTGELAFDAKVGDGGSIAVEFSDNHGLDWRLVANVTAAGKQTVDLKPFAARRYDYRLRFALKGRGTGIDSLRITHDIQHSQRPLPALDKGENKITFSAGPQEGTISIEGAGLKLKGRGVTYEDFHAVLENVSAENLAQWGTIAPAGGASAKCSVTFPVETPGDMKRLRFGCNYRATDKADAWDLLVSLDGGKTFVSAGKAQGPTRANGKFVVFSDIPAGTRKALVRYEGTQKGSVALFRWRIDADYAEPAGGFAPIRVTYTWDENGQAKEDVHVAKTAEEAWTLRCDAKPTMKSIVLEREPQPADK